MMSLDKEKIRHEIWIWLTNNGYDQIPDFSKDEFLVSNLDAIFVHLLKLGLVKKLHRQAFRNGAIKAYLDSIGAVHVL